MSQNSLELNAEPRDKVGSRAARKLRRDGKIPVSLQADGDPHPVNLAIDEVTFLASRRKHVHLYDMQVAGKLESALVRELQWDAFGDRIIHIDFKKVERGVATETEVELEFTGHPKSGILNHLVTQITIRTLPSNIPDSIEVRVNDLEVGEHVRAGDLEMPEGVELAVPEDFEVAVVSAERQVIEPTAEDEEGEAAEPEAAPEPPEDES